MQSVIFAYRSLQRQASQKRARQQGPVSFREQAISHDVAADLQEQLQYAQEQQRLNHMFYDDVASDVGPRLLQQRKKQSPPH